MTSIIKVDQIQDAATQHTLNLGSGNSSLPGSLDLSGGGVYLGGTGSANLLDDYEVGTWTPTCENTGSFSGTISASYIKIGRQVTAFCYIGNLDNISTTDNLDIGGLPFASSSDVDSYVGTCMTRYLDVSVTEEMGICSFIAGGSDILRIYVLATGGTYQRVSNNEFGNSGFGMRINITYLTT